MKILKKLQHTFLKTKLITVHNFRDYKAEEKAKIIRKATKDSNKMQRELADKYNRQFAM